MIWLFQATILHAHFNNTMPFDYNAMQFDLIFSSFFFSSTMGIFVSHLTFVEYKVW